MYIIRMISHVMLANLKRRAHLHAPEAQRPNAREHAGGACSPKCFSQ